MTTEEVPAEEAVPAFMIPESMITERDWGRSQVPAYRVSEVARIFFGMSESWVRLKLRPDVKHPLTWFVLHGKKMEFRRKNPEKGDSERTFLLSDIEPMAWSLRLLGAISARRFAHVLRVVEAQAHLYELLSDEPDSDPPGDPGGEEE